MQYEPKKRLSWDQMRQHPFFSAAESMQIPFNLVFDQDPPEGIVFKNNKIYVNTKDPRAY